MKLELKKLLDSISSKKQEVKDLVKAGKLEEATKAKEELKEMQAEFNLLYDLDIEQTEEMEQKAASGTAKTVKDKEKTVATAFMNAIRAAFKKKAVSAEDSEILNEMSEGSDEDGGLTVPKDIQTTIKELRRSEDALELLVNTERVSTESGSRVIERSAEHTPFDNVDEAADFPEESTPQFDKIEYKIKKKGGILKVTQELLSDTNENILGYLKRWIAKKAKATRNFLIINKIREMTKDAEVEVSGLDDLKRIFNVKLDPAIELTSVIITNQDGFNWLDTIKDKDGKYILQPDPSKPTSTLLFGRYPVKKVSNKSLKSVAVENDYKIPLICGDPKEAITIFDRETLTIDISNVAGDLWKKDQTGMKVRERLDIQSVDTEAIIMGEHLVITTTPDKNEETDDEIYSAEELDKITKAQIFELAVQSGYTMTTTESNSKAEIIEDFLAQQAAAQ